MELLSIVQDTFVFIKHISFPYTATSWIHSASRGAMERGVNVFISYLHRAHLVQPGMSFDADVDYVLECVGPRRYTGSGSPKDATTSGPRRGLRNHQYPWSDERDA